MESRRYLSPPLTTLTLSVLIVNYRSWPDVVRLVASLVSGSPPLDSARLEIVVVDNDSREPIPESLADGSLQVRLVIEPENGGFSAGVNAGWRASGGRWLLVLNPDVVPPRGLISQVLDRIASYEAGPGLAPGVVGFELRNPDGSHQPSVGRFPSLVRTVWEQVIPRSRRKYQPDWRLRPGLVDWVTGACMLVNRRLLDDLGGMDEEFFLYHEEVALCRSARLRGWSVVYDPKVSVVHLRPLQNRPISPKMRVVTRHSKLLYFRKHLPRWQFTALVSVVWSEARLRGTLSRLHGRARDARSWRAVERVARLVGSGAELPGKAVRDLAEAVEVEEPDDDPDRAVDDLEVRQSSTDQDRPRSRRRRRSRGARSSQTRKDGP